MRTISHIEAEFILDCRELDLLCYQIRDRYQENDLTKELVKNSERLVLEGIEPIYENVNGFRHMWHKYTHIYIHNIKNIVDSLHVFSDMVPGTGAEIIFLCDKLAKRYTEIYNGNLMELEN